MRCGLPIILILAAFVTRAQDLIVTTSGDSIKCRINTVTQNRLFFTVRMEDYSRPDKIDLDHVAMYKREGYFPVIMGDVGALRKEGQPKDDHGWLLSATFGSSHRTAPLEDGLSQEEADYMNGQRSGLHASGSLHYFITEEVAVGAVYNGSFGAGNSMPVSILLQDSTTVQGVLAEDVRLRYLGLDFLFRAITIKAVSPFGAVGIGRLVYENRATLINNFTITGSGLALNVRAGLECRISSKMSIGASLGYFVSRLNRFEIDTGSQKVGFTLPDRAEENLDRADLALVARIRL